MIIDLAKATTLPKCCISAIVTAALLVTGAEAAQLTNIQGAVLVDHGNGFIPVAGPVLLAPGDRVHAAAGVAYVVYDNNCSQKVAANQTVAVLAAPPACDLKDGVIANEASPFPADALAVGGMLAVGGVAAALASSGNTSTSGTSASP